MKKLKLTAIFCFLISAVYFALVFNSNKLPTELLGLNGELDKDKVALFIEQLRDGVRPTEASEYKDLANNLTQILLETEFSDANAHQQYTLLVSNLLLELSVASSRYSNLADFKVKDEIVAPLFNELRFYLRDTKQDKAFSLVERQYVADLLLTYSVSSSQLIERTELESLLSVMGEQKDQNEEVLSALIVSLWLDRDSKYYETNLPYIFIAREQLGSKGDLIRSIGSDDEQYVLASLRLIEELIPDNAIHALRYRLINSGSEQVKLATLRAISQYGMAARPYSEQFKAYLRHTKSDVVKNKILTVLKNINGL